MRLWSTSCRVGIVHEVMVNKLQGRGIVHEVMVNKLQGRLG